MWERFALAQTEVNTHMPTILNENDLKLLVGYQKGEDGTASFWYLSIRGKNIFHVESEEMWDKRKRLGEYLRKISTSTLESHMRTKDNQSYRDSFDILADCTCVWRSDGWREE